MEVYTLTGKSGTGKSYQAASLAEKYGIESIIDDGLFIYRGQVAAGTSAKHEKTKVGAIKAAVFVRPEHRKEVAASIKKKNPKSILILGTSDAMADKICQMLDLPPAVRRIHIEDIVTPEEIQIAETQRHELGKHVIPVATFQLKRDFAGYFREPLRILRQAGERTVREHEKTVVRPTYSYMGDFVISVTVISDIARLVAEECEGIRRASKVFENTETESLEVDVDVEAERLPGLWENAKAYQTRLKDRIEEMTAFNVVTVNVTIDRLVEAR